MGFGTPQAAPAQIPLGLDAKRTQGVSWERAIQGLPEVVDRFKKFVDALAVRYEVVIGIDELDKLAPDKVEAFLNEVKAIFSIRGCHYLISVSEDAEAGFQRRGIPFRTVFDSCFDELVDVGYLDRGTSTELLRGRVIGLPTPLVWASHSLAGGLARDLIRYARALVSGSETAPREAISGVCRKDLDDKIRAICRELTNVSNDPWATRLLVAILGFDGPYDVSASGVALSRYLGEWLADSRASLSAAQIGEDPAVFRQAAELATFALFVATVCEFFGEYSGPRRTEAAKYDRRDPRCIERLAIARQAMSQSPLIAEQRLSEFREAWHLGTLSPVATALGGIPAGHGGD